MSKTIFFMMGVSGSGKSTIGKLLAKRLDISFFDGDDFHSKENVAKMESGKPLNDEDRKGWLESLNTLAIQNKEKGVVIACSALKEEYRVALSKSIEELVEFVYLKGSFEEIEARLKQRKGHFMPLDLLKSQFDVLVEPENATIISINSTPEEIVAEIIQKK